MKKSHRGIWIVSFTLILTIIITLTVNHKATNMVFRNLTAPVYHFDESQDDWDGGSTYLGVQYSDVSPNDYVNIYVPVSGEAPPLYVLIHGGGFVSGVAESKQAQMIYRYFRDHGFACASVNYRLAQEAPFPGAVKDCKAAIRFLRAHADEYGYNADRIAVFGESAGGYLAVMCAVTNDDEFNDLPFIGQGALGDVSAKVDVLVDYYGVKEWDLKKYLPDIELPTLIYDIANSWVGDLEMEGFDDFVSYWLRKEITELTAEELAVSDPYTYIEKNLPGNNNLSAWIIHGDCDMTVPYPQSDRLNKKLVDILGPDRVTYRLIPNMGHASDPLYSEEILADIEGFLKEHLA
ncbi:MAG: alpha/beta hydrolase [Lachnospiraceae bacterium]|nr:alpha/beta hydrolase [Lachnospiraceae bacterium]